MRELLDHRGIRLTKSLGQNFLHDQNQLRRVVAAAELSGNDKVLEIGPGLGPLTELLLETGGEVLAIETDSRLVEFLRERFLAPGSAPGAPHLKLLHADALRFLRQEAADWRDWKVVSNLPYSVASPILVELACGRRAPRRIVATLQSEVAQRLTARAGDEDYGLLTLLVQLDYEPRDCFRIPAGCFFPEPKVDSACVVLHRRLRPLLPEPLRGSFIGIVKRAFSQRRKMTMKLLRTDWPRDNLSRAFAAAGISPQERAEKLALEQFVELAKLLEAP